MTMVGGIAPTSPAPVPPSWAREEPLFAAAAAISFIACLPILAAMGLDERTYQGVSVWAKPLKFLASLVTYFAMLAWAASFIAPETKARPLYRAWAGLITACAAAEMVWIIGAAANGVPSHFNTGSPLMAAAYTAAGVGAVTLLTGAPVYGVLIWRSRRRRDEPGALRLSLILGLILTFPLTFVIAGYLGGAGGHFVGEAGASAEGMILSGWARDGGDLRVGHFFALHAMHAIPAFGWIAARRLPAGPAATAVVWAFATTYGALTVFAFLQALAGRPFLPMIP